MVARPFCGIISLAFVAGALLLQFLVVLSGTTTAMPENLIYFLQASTNGIPGARNPSRWTFFAICGADDKGHNTNCGAIVPALPFDPPNHHDFGTTTGVPDGFIGSHRFYYLSRFMFAFYIMALAVGAWTFITGMLGVCTRFASFMSSANAAIAFVFQALAAALLTVWAIDGRHNFRKGGLDAHVGVKAMAFTWTAAACYLIATLTFCVGGVGRHHKDRTTKTEYVEERRGFFGRRRRRNVTV